MGVQDSREQNKGKGKGSWEIKTNKQTNTKWYMTELPQLHESVELVTCSCMTSAKDPQNHHFLEHSAAGTKGKQFYPQLFLFSYVSLVNMPSMRHSLSCTLSFYKMGFLESFWESQRLHGCRQIRATVSSGGVGMMEAALKPCSHPWGSWHRQY